MSKETIMTTKTRSNPVTRKELEAAEGRLDGIEARLRVAECGAVGHKMVLESITAHRDGYLTAFVVMKCRLCGHVSADTAGYKWAGGQGRKEHRVLRAFDKLWKLPG